MGPGHQPLHVHRVHSVALESLGGKLNCKVHETKLPSTNTALFVKTECMNSRPMAVLLLISYSVLQWVLNVSLLCWSLLPDISSIASFLLVNWEQGLCFIHALQLRCSPASLHSKLCQLTLLCIGIFS